MRFCPFCAQENPDDERECVHCGKRLPAMRSAPSRPGPAPASKPAPRPVPPRPAPRPRSIAEMPPPSRAPAKVDVHAPTAHAPLGPQDPTLKPPPSQPPPSQSHQPSHREAHPQSPARGPNEATLKPLATIKPKIEADTAELTNPMALPKPPVAPTGTLLGLSAQEIAGLVMPPALESERDSGKRTTKPLSLPHLAGEAKTVDFDDQPTELGAPNMPLDEGPTRPQPRVVDEDEDEDIPTQARPMPKARANDRPTTPPLGVPQRRGTPSAGVPHKPALSMPPPFLSPIETKPTSLPAELPPPPKVSNEAGAFPMLDMLPTPAIPTMVLPPMPTGPKSGSPIEAVKYLVPLGKAMWARKKAQDAIRTLLHGDQRLLDTVLKDLGRVAREEKLAVPALADEMRLMKEQEERRGAAETALAEAESATKKEEERWHIDKGERQAELARRETELKITDEELRAKAEERRGHAAEQAKIDAQIRTCEKRAAAADGRAAKADVTPPEKGGGPNTAANARAEAGEARKEATALIPARDEARAKAEALDGPIATLTKKITEERAALAQKRKDLVDATATHEMTTKQLESDRQRASDDKDAAERELTQRFVTAGTILNLNRVEHPRLQPLFARVDELKNGVNAREAAIVRLESERRLYDRVAVQKGLITVGSALAVVVLLAIILIVVLAR